MKRKREKIYWHNNKNIKVNEELNMEINIEKNFYDIDLDCLFKMAARNNTKRRFLFVSKVLGKHTPVNPKKSLLVGYLLSAEYMKKVYKFESRYVDNVSDAISKDINIEVTFEKILNDKFELTENTLFIGFAETATALGHSVFSNFKGNCEYIHTTRENILNVKSTLSFEELHSHAVDHKIYGEDINLLKSDCPVILIDDEITTGNTNINIIKQLHKKFPRKKYILMSILDWRSKRDLERFKLIEEELKIEITNVSLIKGYIAVKDNMKSELVEFTNDIFKNTNVSIDFNIEKLLIESNLNKKEYSSKYLDNTVNDYPYLGSTGRFGITEENQDYLMKEVLKISKLLKKKRKSGKTLCLGTGEFMYIPMVISANMGDDIYYHSTTRSPIIPDENFEDYAIRKCFRFKGIEDSLYENFLYNIGDNDYKEVFIFFERDVNKEIYREIINIFKMNKITYIYIVVFSKSNFGGCSIDVKPF